MMQETVLRVLVVALGLLFCPRDHPGVEEPSELVPPDMQDGGQRQLREEEELDHVEPPESEEILQTPSEALFGAVSDTPVNQQELQSRGNETSPDLTGAEEEQNVDQKLPDGHVGDITETGPFESGNTEPNKTMVSSVSDNKKEETPQDHSRRLREKESVSSVKESPFPRVETQNKTSSTADLERDYLWYIWNTLSVISIMRFLRKFLRSNVHLYDKANKAVSDSRRAPAVPLPDGATLQCFYAKCVRSQTKRRVDDFLEGFANDLVEAMRAICEENGRWLLEDFRLTKVGEILVYVGPPESFHFQRQLWKSNGSDPPSDLQVCGRIKLMKSEVVTNGCPCQSSDADDDMVCLLHSESSRGKTKVVEAGGALLCAQNSAFLSKSKVTRWFQNTIKQAWAQISHKYEFDMTVRYVEAPGAMVIRFRSGKTVSFSINPVVKFNCDSHFFISPWSCNDLDTFWGLSLTAYEDRLYESLCKQLPDNSCHKQTLEIALFLHKKQRALSGSTELKDYHFKTALLHLLLSRKPCEWQPNLLACRLRDLLSFIQKSIEKKLLTHVLIGSRLPEVIGLPKELSKARPVNLFHPFVVHNCVHRNATMNFLEMLQNAEMLINDYVAQHTNSNNT